MQKKILITILIGTLVLAGVRGRASAETVESGEAQTTHFSLNFGWINNILLLRFRSLEDAELVHGAVVAPGATFINTTSVPGTRITDIHYNFDDSMDVILNIPVTGKSEGTLVIGHTLGGMWTLFPGSETGVGQNEHFVIRLRLKREGSNALATVTSIVDGINVGELNTTVPQFQTSTWVWGYSTPEKQYKPTVKSEDLYLPVGSAVDWLTGIEGQWGGDMTKKIPPHGEIRITSLIGGTDTTLTDDNVTFSRVGSSLHTYEIRDDHSLSPLYPFDDTFTTTTRKINIYTTAEPVLRKHYAPSAAPGLSGDTYTLILPLPCGGESGWTNQPLDISIHPDTIVGTFDIRLILTDFTTTATNTIATRTNYYIESPDAFGTPLSGVLTAVGDESTLLSSTVNSFVKIDKTNPIPAATHISGYNFTDDSTDALSGLSITRPSEIAFSAPSGPQPASGDFSTFDSIPIMPDGTYDVWVRATDKAGNTATERVLADIILLNGTVGLTKDTDQGATLHIAGCPDFDSIAITSCTPECSLGANVEIEEKSSLTYKLTLTNTDLTDTASGTFEDYLPEGTIISTMPVVTPVGSATVAFDLETTGPYTGRYKVSGSYTNLAPNGQIEIDILTRAQIGRASCRERV